MVLVAVDEVPGRARLAARRAVAALDQVIARAADGGVAPGSGNHRVVAVACVEEVVAGTALNRVGPGLPVHHVIPRAGLDGVIPHRPRMESAPARPKTLSAPAPARTSVGADVTVEAIGPPVGGTRHVAVDQVPVARGAAARRVDPGKDAVAAGAAFDRIAAGTGDDQVVTRPAEDQVGTGAGGDLVVAADRGETV